MRTLSSEYDQRQLGLMRATLSEFGNGDVGLAPLINSLNGLLVALQDIPEEWKDSFREEWWTLEQVYSVALDRAEDPMTGDYKAAVDEAASAMKDLLDKIDELSEVTSAR